MRVAPSVANRLEKRVRPRVREGEMSGRGHLQGGRAQPGAHLARESEITPSSPKVRRELFEIALQEQILFAAK